MTDSASHYSKQLDDAALAQLVQRIQHSFPNDASPQQLASIDQLHIGGLQASEKLIAHLPTHSDSRILEIGAGLGGLQRLYCHQLSETISARYTTLDITPAFSTLNRVLNQLSTQTKHTQVITGDGQQLAFPDQHFDAVVLQHSLLNMPDHQQCLQECQRVLKPGGKLILHEVLRGNTAEPISFPVPWACSEAGSHLLSAVELSALLNNNSFTIRQRSNWSAEALVWRKQHSRKEAQPEALTNRLSPQDIFGTEFLVMAKNLLDNLQRGAVEVHEIVAEKR